MGYELRTSLRGRDLPIYAYLAGYSALIDRFDLQVPLPYELNAIAPTSRRQREGGWNILPSSLAPGDSTVEQLIFALKHEGLQLLILKRVFEVFDPDELETAARARPTSGYVRRLCHLYEWLLRLSLAIPDVSAGNYVELADRDRHYTTETGMRNRRFRVTHNLAGSRDFCPIVFRTRRLDAFLAANFSKKAHDVMGGASRDLIARAAAFLLLSDSKASFAIEGENPSPGRLTRWASAIGQSGSWALDLGSLVTLQRALIGDDRFVRIGLRQEGGFVGRHDAMGLPVPEHVSARAADLRALIAGLVAFEATARAMEFHPVLTAACIAFGFVYIHPFEDGNGRIHRFLMHHVLAERAFTPAGIVFPISSVILDEIVAYKAVLERVSAPLLEWIAWRPTETGNVEVLNDTIDFYAFFDATAHCEFLLECIQRAVEKDLPEELGFLEHRDVFHRRVTDIVDMSERKLDQLLRFLKQGHGALSKRARTKEFAALSEAEVQEVQAVYAELFGFVDR